MDLTVNGDKIKLMVSTTKTSSRIGPQVKVENHNFEVVNYFIYLGTAINKTNDISFEIKRRTILANRCYFEQSKQFKNKAISRQTKITLYRKLILSVLLYGTEAWVLAKANEAVLGMFERKIIRTLSMR